MSTTTEPLQAFVNHVAEYLKGDEKGEAPIFLDKFFRAFGHEGAIEAGATYEERIHKGITKLYNAYFDEPASQLYKLHKQLDTLVLQAYGFSADDDLLEQLLTLNLALAAKEQNGQPVIGPWDPTK